MERKKIIVIDDSDLWLMEWMEWVSYMKENNEEFKEKYEYIEIGVTSSIKEAINKINKYSPDIIFLDHFLSPINFNSSSLGDGVRIAKQIGSKHLILSTGSNSCADSVSFDLYNGTNVQHFPGKNMEKVFTCLSGTCDCLLRFQEYVSEKMIN